MWTPFYSKPSAKPQSLTSLGPSGSSFRSGALSCPFCRHLTEVDYMPMYKYAMMDFLGGPFLPELQGGCTCQEREDFDSDQVEVVTRPLISPAVVRDLALAASAAVAAVVLVVVLGMWG